MTKPITKEFTDQTLSQIDMDTKTQLIVVALPYGALSPADLETLGSYIAGINFGIDHNDGFSPTLAAAWKSMNAELLAGIHIAYDRTEGEGEYAKFLAEEISAASGRLEGLKAMAADVEKRLWALPPDETPAPGHNSDGNGGV